MRLPKSKPKKTCIVGRSPDPHPVTAHTGKMEGRPTRLRSPDTRDMTSIVCPKKLRDTLHSVNQTSKIYLKLKTALTKGKRKIIHKSSRPAYRHRSAQKVHHDDVSMSASRRTFRHRLTSSWGTFFCCICLFTGCVVHS